MKKIEIDGICSVKKINLTCTLRDNYHLIHNNKLIKKLSKQHTSADFWTAINVAFVNGWAVGFTHKNNEVIRDFGNSLLKDKRFKQNKIEAKDFINLVKEKIKESGTKGEN